MTQKGHHNEGGKSSFAMVDTERLFSELQLRSGITFLDVGSGRGEYSLAAAKIIGELGSIIAVDQWAEGIEKLRQEAYSQGINSVDAYVCDISREIPADDSSVDVCLLSAVLHGLLKNDTFDGTFKEVLRVLKSGGILAIIEWKKVEGPPGPSKTIRLTEIEVENLLKPMGFNKKQVVDLGQYFYLVTLELGK